MGTKLDQAKAKIIKQYGEGSLISLDDDFLVPIERIPTGALSLDLALGGGLPRGRIVEAYGPESSGKTTVALHALAEAQKLGLTCAFIDAEHALDPVYAQAIGVRFDETMLFAQPDSGEQALEIALELTQSGEVGFIVIDSVAALTPQAEINGDIGDSHVGLQARLMSQALRMLTGPAQKNGTTIFFINQLREKIGVMFGCFHYDARVVLADGTTEKIGKIVNQRMDVEVLSYDENLGIVPRKIVDWHDNGVAEQFLAFEICSGAKQGLSKFSCTENHMIFTPNGEVPAGTLKPGDLVSVRVTQPVYNDEQWQVLYGAMLGDGSLRATSVNKATVRFKHGKNQSDYQNWLRGFFLNRNGSGFVGYPTGEEEFSVEPTTTLYQWFNKFGAMKRSGPSVRNIPPELIELLDVKAVAIWYMDDGNLSGSFQKWGNGKITISVKSVTQSSVEYLVDRLSALGLGQATYDKKYGRLTWSGQNSKKFQSVVAPYINESMQYKLAPAFRGVPSGWHREVNIESEDILTFGEIKNVYVKPKDASTHKFDITVEGNHNYFVDNILVHNSPETTPGGRALKFYASVRLDVRRKDQIKDGAEVTGNLTVVKVVKNKTAPPFRTAEFDIVYGHGISREGCIVDLAEKYGLLKKKGAWYADVESDTNIGQGREKAKMFLEENPEYTENLYYKIMELA